MSKYVHKCLYTIELCPVPLNTCRTTWNEFIKLLEHDKTFQRDDELQIMDQSDMLGVFRAHIRYLEDRQEELRDRKKLKLRRFQRKNRDAFQVFLEELHEYGTLTSLSLWSELYPVISKDDRYTVLLLLLLVQ